MGEGRGEVGERVLVWRIVFVLVGLCVCVYLRTRMLYGIDVRGRKLEAFSTSGGLGFEDHEDGKSWS